MKKAILYSISLILLLARTFGAYAQEGESPIDKHIPTIIPPSPDAASLGKYGEFPVSLYTGTPSISVPIGQVSGHAIQVPISLSYHASGVKVEDIAPWVGLGWSLNAGGAITRVVKDKADDHVDGWLTKTSQDYTFPLTSGDPGYVQYLYNAADGNIDSQPDLYNFNFMGYSGKFFLDKNRKAHLIPHKDIEIIVPSNFESGEWVIITEDGTKYKFGGNTGGISLNNYTETTISETIGADSPSPSHVSAWYLKEVSRQDRSDKVTFEYEKEGIKYDTRVSYTDYSSTAGCEAKSPTTSYSNTINYTLHIKKIYVNDKLAAEFNNTLSSSIDNDMALFTRSDVFQSDGSTPASALKEITLYSVIDDQTPVKRFIMEYDHFVSTETSAYSNWVTSNLNTTALTHRLRLKSVKEVSVEDPSDKKLLSAFTYKEGLPRRSSMSQDYWGYYNGALNNTLLPSIHGYKGGEGADRSVNPEVITNGMLTRIDYPTGGHSIFNFKAHRKEIEETLILPEPKVLSFDQTYGSTGTNYSLGSFTLTHDQVITLEYNIEHPFSLESDGIATIFIENQPDLWSSGGENTVTKLLTAGTYNLKTNIDLANTTVSGTLSYEKENPNGTSKAIAMDIDGLVAGNTKTSSSFILAKPSSILFNINSSLGTNSASVRLYREGVFVQEVTPVNGIASHQLSITNLLAGEYTYEVVNTGSSIINNLTVSAGYIWYYMKNVFIGGLKVVKIENYDGTGNSPLVKQFDYEDLKEVSPIDDSNFLHTQTELANAQCPDGYGNLCGYTVRTSSNRSFLGATQGSPVGYKKVTTIIGENAEMGKTIDEFTFYGNVGGGGFPFPPATDNQHKSGLLEKQTVYNAAGVKLKESSNTYNFIPLASIDAQTASYRYNHPCIANDGTENYTFLQYDLITLSTTFSYNSEWVQNISTTETVYDLDDPSNFITNTTTNSYSDASSYGTADFNTMVKSTSSINSKGEELITEMKYPTDINLGLDSEAESARLLLKQHHRINVVLEQVVKKRNGVDLKQISKIRNNYFTTQGYVQKRDVEIALTNNNGSLEPRVNFNNYDHNGHLLEYEKTDDNTNVSYIWAYKNTLPIAKTINNNDRGTRDDIDHTSFETDDFQISTDFAFNDNNVIVDNSAPTGGKVFQFNLSQSITRSGLTSNTKYVLSFWAKGSNVTVNGVNYSLTSEWRYLEIPFTNKTNLTITGTSSSIDELRLYPKGALMTTYTYKPMVGITSVCDANNIITYYKYDAFGRLEYVIDADKNILKKHEYKYQSNSTN